METIVIRYEKSNRAARKLIEALIASGNVTVAKKKKTGLQKALEEVRSGKTYPVINPENAVAEILSENV